MIEITYIYGIFEDGKCLYIGQTKREPFKRFNEHKRDIKNKKHKIKSLNKFEVDNLEFKILFTLNYDNTLLLSIAECCFNSIYKPKNRCILQQGSNRVILQRCDKDIAAKLLEVIK